MATSTLVDLVKIYVASVGTGAVTLGSAVPSYRGREALTNGQTYSYSIQQEGTFEYGRGVYLATGHQFVRTPFGSSSGGVALNLQPNAAIAFVVLAEDIVEAATGIDFEALAQAAVDEATANFETDQKLTRDPYVALRETVGTGAFGTTTYFDSDPTTVPTLFVGAFFGTSLAVGQGITDPNAAPLEQARTVITEVAPELNDYWDQYGVPGSWQTQMAAQIDTMFAAHAAAMSGGDGRRRIPDVAFLVTGTNSARTTIYHSLEGPRVFREVLARDIRRLQAVGTLVIVVDAPPIHTPRSLPSDYHMMSPAFFTTWPSNAFYAGDDIFQTLTYSVADQSISSSTPGQFTPGLFDNGWLSFDGRSWVYVPEQDKYMRIIGADPSYTTLFVDNGSGGDIITENRSTAKGLYQARIDDQRQLVPARNNADLSRPVAAQANVPLALETRPIGPAGEDVLVALRLIEINRAIDEVTRATGAIKIPWHADICSLLTSTASLDTIYPGSEFLHPGDMGYYRLTPLLRRIFVPLFLNA